MKQGYCFKKFGRCFYFFFFFTANKQTNMLGADTFAHNYRQTNRMEERYKLQLQWGKGKQCAKRIKHGKINQM